MIEPCLSFVHFQFMQKCILYSINVHNVHIFVYLCHILLPFFVEKLHCAFFFSSEVNKRRNKVKILLVRRFDTRMYRLIEYIIDIFFQLYTLIKWLTNMYCHRLYRCNLCKNVFVCLFVCMFVCVCTSILYILMLECCCCVATFIRTLAKQPQNE